MHILLHNSLQNQSNLFCESVSAALVQMKISLLVQLIQDDTSIRAVMSRFAMSPSMFSRVVR